MEQLKSMKQCLIACAQAQMNNLQNVDAKELGEVIDMIKDLEEACYYATITKAMTEENKKEKYLYRQTIRQGFQSPQLSTIIGETEKRRFAVCKIHRQARQEL